MHSRVKKSLYEYVIYACICICCSFMVDCTATHGKRYCIDGSIETTGCGHILDLSYFSVTTPSVLPIKELDRIPTVSVFSS